MPERNPSRRWSGALRQAWASFAALLAVFWGAAGWRCLGSRRELFLDAGAWLRSAGLWVWLTFLSLATVWTDATGRARSPIPVRAGPGRCLAAVCLVAAESELQLRLLAHFWRAPHDDQSCQALQALVARHRSAAPLDVSGVIVFSRSSGRALPLPFRAQINLAARTTTLTHGRAAADPETRSTVCAHAAAPILMDSAALDCVLAPLLARRICPALFEAE